MQQLRVVAGGGGGYDMGDYNNGGEGGGIQ